jgi:deoxyribose-phosphate aldolase
LLVMEAEERIARIKSEVLTALGIGLRDYHTELALPQISDKQRQLTLEDPVNVASLFDHTALKVETTPQMVEKLCEEAIHYKFFAVCLNPIHVKLASELLSGSGVKVASVAGFPLAGSHPKAKAFEAECAIEDGAEEIDMVVNISALKVGELKVVKEDIDAVRSVCGPYVALKVIIEAGALSFEEKIRACTIAKACRADFVKTSTGFGPSGATPEDVRLMRQVVGEKMGVKASAGIRDLKTALAMVKAGANRIGCSASVGITKEALGEK